MNWTNKQWLSLVGAASIQGALFWMFFHQTVYLPVASIDERETGMMWAQWVEHVDAAPAISLSAVPIPPTRMPDADALLKISDVHFPGRLSEQDMSFRADYLPAAVLTDKPSVVIDIDPELSRRFAFILPQSLELHLLINEYGDVDRVLPAGPLPAEGSTERLPPVLLEELKQRFLEARFLPGRLHGQAVRSALTIRVSLGP